MWATGQGETATEMGGLCKEGSLTEDGDKQREKAADREKWEGITAVTVQQYMNSPLYREQRGRTTQTHSPEGSTSE